MMVVAKKMFSNDSNRNYSGRMHGEGSSYFTELTASKALLYVIAVLYVGLASIVSLAEPFLTLCRATEAKGFTFENPAYDASPCRHERFMILAGLTPEECSFGRRLVASIFLGGIIGWERRQADRPAGIRTMSLVSLGSCLFTINSSFAFLNGPMAWDASRVSAAIPSGVGFLGAGLIFKKQEKTDAGENNHVVTGLTTAASLWLSAAVGIACGGDLFFAASFGTALMMLLLRFGPRGQDHDESDEDAEEIKDMTEAEPRTAYSSFKRTDDASSPEERQSLTRSASRTSRASFRKRAALASMV